MGRGKRPTITLRPIGLGDDGAVILATRAGAKTGSYRLQVTDVLLEMIRNARVAPAPRAESKLTPRDIQGLLREGKDVAAIAHKAGVDPAWVRKFEGPILWERAGMADRARAATLVRARMGSSGEPLGDAVAANLERRGVPGGNGASVWDAIRHPKKRTWMVTCSFAHRGRSHCARWEFDPESEELTPLSKLAGDIGWVAPKKRKR